MIRLCEQASPFIDGELSAAEAEVFREHLVECLACQIETEEALVLEWLVEAAGAGAGANGERESATSPRPSTNTTASSSRWRRSLVWAGISVVAAAAAALVMFPVLKNSEPNRLELIAAFQEVLSPTRPFEARLSYPGADLYRSYNVARSDTSVVENIPAHLLASFEETKSRAALTAAYTLMGAHELALQTLEPAINPAITTSSEKTQAALVLIDRSALSLQAAKPSAALIESSKAIELDPNQAAAQWNRALALAKIHLPLAAARAFETVAEIGEPGWSQEARTRAKGLRQSYQTRKARWQSGFDSLEELAKGGSAPSDDIVREFPGLARLGFYDAVRSTADPSRLDELEEFAQRLEQLIGSSSNDFSFVDFIQSVRTRKNAARLGLSTRYAAVRASFGKKPDPTLFADAIGAGQQDIALGVLFWEPRLDTNKQNAYLKLGRSSRDPWLELLAKERIVRDQVQKGSALEAIKLARKALAECNTRAFEFRCLRIEFWLSMALVHSHDPVEASQVAKAGIRSSLRTNDWVMETRFLAAFTEISATQDDVTGSQLALTRAFLDEQRLRTPGCVYEIYATKRLANAYINQHQPKKMAYLLESLDQKCPDEQVTLDRLGLDAYLVGANTDRATALLSKLSAVVVETGSTDRKAFAAHIAGRALMGIDPKRSEAKLREAIALATRDPLKISSRRARGFSFALLAEEAARQNDFKRSLNILAEEVGATANRCAIGVSLEASVLTVALDENGIPAGMLNSTTKAINAVGTAAIPAAILGHVNNCETLDVFARPPFLGRAILPPRIPWRFILPRTSPGSHSGSLAKTTTTTAKREVHSPRHLIVSAPEAPSELGLTPLTPSPNHHADLHLQGPSATPSRVVRELERATFIEIHAHGLITGRGHGGASLILAPEKGGHFTLKAADIEKTNLRGTPIVVLSACQAALIPSYQHLDLGLAGAFLASGARAVIASPEPIPDKGAYEFFDSLREQLEKGDSPLRALASARAHHPQFSQWTQQVVLFELTDTDK